MNNLAKVTDISNVKEYATIDLNYNLETRRKTSLSDEADDIPPHHWSRSNRVQQVDRGAIVQHSPLIIDEKRQGSKQKKRLQQQ